jgi:hypothetical protein
LIIEGLSSRPLLLLGMCLLASSLVFGETTSESEDENQAQSEAETDKWQFVVAPLYLWAAGISGTSGIGPVTAPLNITFENALDNLDGVFTFHGEARKNKTGFFTDFMYLDLSPKTTGPGGIPLNISLTNAVWEVGASYRVRKASPVVEVLAGARTSFLSLKTLPVGPAVDETWVDGFGGVRLGHRFGKNDNWRLSGRADVGAGQSDLTWSSTLLMSYRVKEWLSVDAGYKWLSYDYETGSGFNRFAYDVTYQGPIAGFELHW